MTSTRPGPPSRVRDRAGELRPAWARAMVIACVVAIGGTIVGGVLRQYPPHPVWLIRPVLFLGLTVNDGQPGLARWVSAGIILAGAIVAAFVLGWVPIRNGRASG